MFVVFIVCDIGGIACNEKVSGGSVGGDSFCGSSVSGDSVNGGSVGGGSGSCVNSRAGRVTGGSGSRVGGDSGSGGTISCVSCGIVSCGSIIDDSGSGDSAIGGSVSGDIISDDHVSCGSFHAGCVTGGNDSGGNVSGGDVSGGCGVSVVSIRRDNAHGCSASGGHVSGGNVSDVSVRGDRFSAGSGGRYTVFCHGSCTGTHGSQLTVVCPSWLFHAWHYTIRTRGLCTADKVSTHTPQSWCARGHLQHTVCVGEVESAGAEEESAAAPPAG